MKKLDDIPVYEQFRLDQEFSEKDLDYSIADQYTYAMRQLSHMSTQCFWIFDYFKNNFYFISDNTDFFPPNERNTVIKNGYAYFIRNTHPNDILYLLAIHQAAWSFFRSLPQRSHMTHYKVCYIINLRSATGDFIPVSQQVTPLVVDKRGNGWLSLGLFEKVSDQLSFFPYIQNTCTGEKFLLNEIITDRQRPAAPELSDRERELLYYLNLDYTQNKMAEMMHISPDTLNTHRKSLYRKLKASSKAEALKNAYYMGFNNKEQ